MIEVSFSKKILESKHYISDINQKFHPLGIYHADSEEIVYCDNLINKTSIIYLPIIMKELFAMVKKEGNLIIDYKPFINFNFQKFEEYLWWLFKDQYEIVFHGAISNDDYQFSKESQLQGFINNKVSQITEIVDTETLLPKSVATITKPIFKNGFMRLFLKKKVNTTIDNDDINKWSFGIITNGKRKEWINMIVDSIRKQKIPHYEIIICGTYYDRKEDDIKYLPFNQRDDLAWITKKKNLIAKEAKFQNLFILHDRIKLVDNWFEVMKNWGNTFEFICPIFGSYPSSSIFLFGRYAFPYNLKVEEFSIFNYSAFILTKKNIYNDVMLRETSYWSGNNNSIAEDVLFGYDIAYKGYIYRNIGEKMIENLADGTVQKKGLFQRFAFLYHFFRFFGFYFEKRSVQKILYPIFYLYKYFYKSSSVTKKIK